MLVELVGQKAVLHNNVLDLRAESEDKFQDRNLENSFVNKKNSLEESKCGSMNKMIKK